MAGNAESAKRAAKVNNQRTELTIDGETIKIEPGTFYQVVGRIGGQNGNTGGFYANRELARIAGSKGGKVSKRKPSVKA